MPRKKTQTNDKSKPPTEERTPFQKFEQLAKKLTSVPKGEIQKKEGKT